MTRQHTGRIQILKFKRPTSKFEASQNRNGRLVPVLFAHKAFFPKLVFAYEVLTRLAISGFRLRRSINGSPTFELDILRSQAPARCLVGWWARRAQQANQEVKTWPFQPKAFETYFALHLGLMSGGLVYWASIISQNNINPRRAMTS